MRRAEKLARTFDNYKIVVKHALERGGEGLLADNQALAQARREARGKRQEARCAGGPRPTHRGGHRLSSTRRPCCVVSIPNIWV